MNETLNNYDAVIKSGILYAAECLRFDEKTGSKTNPKSRKTNFEENFWIEKQERKRRKMNDHKLSTP